MNANEQQTNMRHERRRALDLARIPKVPWFDAKRYFVLVGTPYYCTVQYRVVQIR